MSGIRKLDENIIRLDILVGLTSTKYLTITNFYENGSKTSQSNSISILHLLLKIHSRKSESSIWSKKSGSVPSEELELDDR